MSNDRLSNPRVLAAIERARKLLARAYDKASTQGERELALRKAKEALATTGLTIEDLKDQSTPDYLTGKTGSVVGGYSDDRASRMAQQLRRGGWKPEDPAKHGYKDNRGNHEEERISPAWDRYRGRHDTDKN